VSLRFLFDEHVSMPACRALQERGVDVVHALEIGLRRALDPEVLDRAVAEGRIVVTRNYADFSALARSYGAAGRSFPGVLFLAVSVRQSDVGAHVASVERWIAAQADADPEGSAAGRSPIADGVGWLSAP
jgi:predicted nuclease of predicted toxin-antitoxin system